MKDWWDFWVLITILFSLATGILVLAYQLLVVLKELIVATGVWSTVQ